MNLASFTNFFSKHPRRRGPLMIVDKTVDELCGYIGSIIHTNGRCYVPLDSFSDLSTDLQTQLIEESEG